MIEEYFKKLRFDKDHHLGLGDIRLTIAQQEEIVEIFNRKQSNEEAVKEAHGSLIEFEKLKFMGSKDKINRWLDAILNEASHRLSDGSLKTIVLIRLELARMQSNEEAVKEAQYEPCNYPLCSCTDGKCINNDC